MFVIGFLALVCVSSVSVGTGEMFALLLEKHTKKKKKGKEAPFGPNWSLSFEQFSQVLNNTCWSVKSHQRFLLIYITVKCNFLPLPEAVACFEDLLGQLYFRGASSSLQIGLSNLMPENNLCVLNCSYKLKFKSGICLLKNALKVYLNKLTVVQLEQGIIRCIDEKGSGVSFYFI